MVADRSGMAASLLSSSVAMCVDTSGFSTLGNDCNGCMNVAWGWLSCVVAMCVDTSRFAR